MVYDGHMDTKSIERMTAELAALNAASTIVPIFSGEPVEHTDAARKPGRRRGTSPVRTR
jgi:hypothetical protein